MKNYVDKDKLQEFTTKLTNKYKSVFATKSEVGSPLKASTVAEMTDTSRTYVYTGSESGYTAGNWYYYNGSAWVSGGVYNAIAFETDATLAVPGMAADAKAVGDALAALPEIDNTLTQTGEAADAKATGDAIAEVEDDVADLKNAFGDITDKYIPENHADVNSTTPNINTSDVAITFSDGDVNFQYPYDAGNPIVALALTGIEVGKTYNFSTKLVSGSLSKITIERVNISTNSRIFTLATATKNGDVYSADFTPNTIPDGNDIAVVFHFSRSMSRDITFSDFSCYEDGDVEKLFVDSQALKDIPESALSAELQQKIDSITIGKSAKISFIGGNVYTSECTLIKFSDGTTMVIDSGTGNRDLIYSEMSRLGITHIDYLMISHYHPDHSANVVYFGQEGLFDENTTFILPMYITENMYTRIPEDPPYWQTYQPEVLQVAEDYGCTIYRPTEDWEKITVGGASVEFLNVDHTDWFDMSTTDYNDCSLCAYLTIGNTSIFFSGDIGLPPMNKYKKVVRHCTIFKANHHAEGYNAVPVFLGSISPDIVVTMQGTRMITKTGTSSIDNQFYYKSNGLQSWCEKYHVYNYLTSFNENNPIGIVINEAGYYFETKSRASNRFEEGIYASDDPDVPVLNRTCFELS